MPIEPLRHDPASPTRTGVTIELSPDHEVFTGQLDLDALASRLQEVAALVPGLRLGLLAEDREPMLWEGGLSDLLTGWSAVDDLQIGLAEDESRVNVVLRVGDWPGPRQVQCFVNLRELIPGLWCIGVVEEVARVLQLDPRRA